MSSVALSQSSEQGSNLCTGLAGIEYSLNVVGYIPYVSSFSGALRIVLGKLEIISAVAIAVIKALVSCVYKGEKKEQMRQEAKEALYFVIHGAANIVRGCVESVPFINLSCILYDHVGKFRVNYPGEPRSLDPRQLFYPAAVIV